MIFWLLIASLMTRILALVSVLCFWRRLSRIQFGVFVLGFVALITQTFLSLINHFAEATLHPEAEWNYSEAIIGFWVSLLGVLFVWSTVRTRGLGRAKSLDRFRIRSQRLTYAAMGIAVFAVVCSLATGWIAYTNSRNAVKEHVADENLTLSQIIANDINQRFRDEEKDVPLSEWINWADEHWAGSRGAQRHSLLIVDKNGKLILHSENPGLIGTDFLNVTEESRAPLSSNLRELFLTGRGQTMEYEDQLGNLQVSGISYLGQFDALVVVQQPSRQIDVGIQKSSMPWFFAMIMIGGILIPISIGLIHFGFVNAQRDAILSSKQLLRNEQKINKQFAELELVYQTAPVGLCLLNCDLEFVRINERLAAINQRPVAEHLGATIRDVLPDIADHIEPIYRRVIETGEPNLDFEIERPGDHPGDPSKHFIASYFPLKDESDEVIGVSTVVQEITQRKQFESDLRQSLHQYRALLGNAPVCIHEVDLLGNLLSMNATGLSMLGLESEDEIRGACYFRSVCDEDRQEVIELFRRALKGERVFFAFRTCDHLEFESSFVPMYDESGQISKLMGITKDVTEQNRARKNLEASERRFRALVENSFDVINMFSSDGRLIYSSPSITRVLGYQLHELVEMDALSIIHPDDRQSAEVAFAKSLLKPDSVSHFVHRLRHKNGSYRTVEVTGTNMLDVPGVNAMVSNFRDITEESETRARLMDLESDLAHVTRLATLGELVAGIAHEVKQPLHAIANFSTAAAVMLQNEQFNRETPSELLDELCECNSGIRTASNRANDIIQRLQGYVRKGQQNIEKISVNHLVDESLTLLSYQTRQLKIDLTVELFESETMASGDRIQLEQVLINLLKNAFEAVKGNKKQRSVKIETQLLDDCWLISVHDNGPGIPAGKDGQLYDAFFTTKREGMGMGLAISRTIIENHGGKIWHTKNEFQGCSFHVSLPIRLEKSIKQSREPANFTSVGSNPPG